MRVRERIGEALRIAPPAQLHIDLVARGGKPTVDKIRPLCSAHNQFEAERVFGAEFMEDKRLAARRGARTNAEAGGS